MATYINTATMEVSTDSQIRKLHSNVSFSKVSDTFADLGWVPVLAAPKPEPSSALKVVRGTSPVVDAQGKWVEGYEEVDMFTDDAEGTKAEKEAAYSAKLAADALQARLDVIMSEFKAEADLIKGGYTQSEIDTFPTQEAEASAYAANSAAVTPLLDAIISASGETKASLVARILNNATAMKLAVGVAIGKKQKKVKEA